MNPFYGLNTGDFAPLPALSGFTLAGPLDLTNMATWNITGPAATEGTYAVSELSVTFQDANNLAVFTRGLFTPGTSLGTQALGVCRSYNYMNKNDFTFYDYRISY